MSNDDRVGYLCAAISVLGFGTNFVPAKQHNMGDGMFFQLQQALGIFFVGVIVQIARGSHSIFRPYAMLGGVLWCTGNCMCSLIIKFIGLSLGLLIWGAFNMLTGWCMGNWGFFGTTKEKPYNAYLNIAGVITAFVGSSLYFFVTPDIEGAVKKKTALEEYTALPDDNEVPMMKGRKTVGLLRVPSSEDEHGSSCHDQVWDKKLIPETSWVDNLSPEQRRLAGITMSIAAGILFGFNFAPALSLIHDQSATDGNGLQYSTNGLDYVFSHFTGILITSLTWFLVYCAAKKNKPWISSEIILPGWLSGVIWGLAQACWFVANESLGVTIAYPIITTGPGVVASLWGVCVFREIKGKQNLTMLMFAFFVSVIAITLICLSKQEMFQSK